MLTLFSNPFFSITISVVILGILLYRQIRPRKISLKSLVIFPVIILYFLVEALPTFHPNPLKLIEILVMSIVSISLGLLACRQLHIYEGASGKAMMKGSWTYLLWWVAAFVIKAILSVLFGDTSFKTLDQFEIFLPVFFLITSRNVYIYWKTQKLKLILH